VIASRLASVEVLAGEQKAKAVGVGSWPLSSDGSPSQQGSVAAGVSQTMAPLTAQGIGEQPVRYWV